MGPMIAFGILLLIVLILVSMHNKLVLLRNRLKNAFSQIDVQLKRRYDLIPNLVQTAEAFMKHERDTLEAVIRARNSAMTANQNVASHPENLKAMQQLIGAEAGLQGAISRLLAVSENYPDLKSNQNMAQLTEELTGTENRIAFARQAYNDAVTVFNTACEVFPNSFVAAAFRFKSAPLFEIASAQEREPVRVKFG